MINTRNFAFKMMDFVAEAQQLVKMEPVRRVKNDSFCIQNDELFIVNEWCLYSSFTIGFTIGL